MRLPVRAALAIAAISTASCVSFVGRYGDPFQVSGDPTYFGNLLKRLNALWGTQVHAVVVSDADRPLVVADPIAAKQPDFHDQCLSGAPLFSFVQLSDVQLRQRNVKLGHATLDRGLREVIPSFESDPMEEEFDWAVYLSHVFAINDLSARWAKSGNEPNLSDRHAPLSFVIHTGDSIDTGTIEELYHYVSISNYLQIPWLNVLGNHDTAVFGNYPKAENYSLDGDVEFYPVAHRASWLYMHNSDNLFGGFGHELLPIPVKGPGMEDSDPTETNSTHVLPRPSFCHGFDLTADQPDLSTMFTNVQSYVRAKVDCSTLRGYYAFDVATQPIRVIGLDSPLKNGKWGNGAELGEAQIAWLDRMLTGTEKKLVFVFAHHPATLLEDTAKGVLLRHAHGNLVYFSGHTHADHLTAITDGKNRFYDLNDGSVMQFPQMGRVIELRSLPGREPNACLVSRWVFPDTMGKSLKEIDKDADRPHAKAGRVLSDTDEIHLADCDSSRVLLRENLPEATRCGHLGAQRDYHREYTFQNAPLTGRPQPYSEARAAANVIIPVEMPR